MQGLHIQGDADQEYLFLPDAAGAPVPAKTIELASSLLSFVRMAMQHPEFSPALSFLTASTAPTLSKFEQLTLSVIALEALLLPELLKSLPSTFARRLSALLAVDDGHRGELKRMAKKLYGYRSAGLHGGPSFNLEGSRTIEQAHGPQALAAAILALASMLGEEVKQKGEMSSPDGGSSEETAHHSLVNVRQRLDHITSFKGNLWGRLPLNEPPGRRAPNRLMRAKEPARLRFFVFDYLTNPKPGGTGREHHQLVSVDRPGNCWRRRGDGHDRRTYPDAIQRSGNTQHGRARHPPRFHFPTPSNSLQYRWDAHQACRQAVLSE